jgi:hypothetical protein
MRATNDSELDESSGDDSQDSEDEALDVPTSEHGAFALGSSGIGSYLGFAHPYGCFMGNTGTRRRVALLTRSTNANDAASTKRARDPSSPLAYGIQNEPRALLAYEETLLPRGSRMDRRVETRRHPKYAFLVSRPDALLRDRTTGRVVGVIEVKCPKLMFGDPEAFASAEHRVLSVPYKTMLQAMVHMAVYNVKFCDVVYWSETHLALPTRVRWDDARHLWKEICVQLDRVESWRVRAREDGVEALLVATAAERSALARALREHKARHVFPLVYHEGSLGFALSARQTATGKRADRLRISTTDVWSTRAEDREFATFVAPPRQDEICRGAYTYRYDVVRDEAGLSLNRGHLDIEL